MFSVVVDRITRRPRKPHRGQPGGGDRVPDNRRREQLLAGVTSPPTSSHPHGGRPTTLGSVSVLAAIVLILTFPSLSLELEITGHWPWQRRPAVRILLLRRKCSSPHKLQHVLVRSMTVQVVADRGTEAVKVVTRDFGVLDLAVHLAATQVGRLRLGARRSHHRHSHEGPSICSTALETTSPARDRGRCPPPYSVNRKPCWGCPRSGVE